MKLTTVIVLVSALGLGGCGPAIVAAARASAATYPQPVSAPAVELLVFGGTGNKTFLGCLSCAKPVEGSMHNEYNDYGSRYSATSIFNRYSDFGSKYSQFSACNPYATTPPVIVSRDGRFFGSLTLNKYLGTATKDKNIVSWLAGVCQS